MPHNVQLINNKLFFQHKFCRTANYKNFILPNISKYVLQFQMPSVERATPSFKHAMFSLNK